MSIVFTSEPTISTKEFAPVLHVSTLGERRPVDDLSRLEGMVRNGDAIVTARNSAGFLVGISQAIPDHQFYTHLSDLAVLATYQGQEIGKQLVRKTHDLAGLQTTLILLSAPAAKEYFPKNGMESNDSYWIIRGDA